MSETTEIKKLVDAAHHLPAEIHTGDGRIFIALPDGDDSYKLEQITLANAADVRQPKVVSQYVAIQTAGSLKTYLNRFKNDDSVLFADIDNNTIVGAIDYHKMPTMLIERSREADHKAASAQAISESPEARLGLHTATLKLPFSKEWQTWTASNEKLMSHVDFANFLEENAIDVIEPYGADLLELCRDLQVRSDSHFSASVRMGDKVSFTYSKDENATTKDAMDMPAEFVLNIPVYFQEISHMIRCLMRRKIAGGDLFLGYKMVRPENLRQAEFQRVASDVHFDTSLTMVYGKRG